MQRSCPASLRQVVQDAGKRQQRWLCQLPGNLTCVWHSQQWWWAEAVAGLVFSVLLPRAGLHDWTADSRGKAAGVPEWGQRRLLRVLPAGVCMKEVVAMAVPSQRSELWASGGFQGFQRHFCRGQTSEVKVNESGYAFNTSRKYYVHQSIIGQKNGPKSTDLWQLSGEKRKPGCCSLHCTFPSHPDHQCQPCTVSGESNGSAPLHDHIWC